MADVTTLLSRFLSNLAFYSGSVSGVLTTNTTSYTNTGTGEEDAWTFPLPANALNVNGQSVRITAWVSIGANANAKVSKLYVGGTAVATRSNTDNGGVVKLEALVIRTGASAQTYLAWGLYSSGSQSGFVGTLAVDNSAAITIKVTVTGAAASDLSFKAAVVELLN